MGFYSRYIFPRLCDFFLDQPFVANHRQQLLAAATGDILEIGFGTGLNLPHYPEGTRQITAVDPNVGMHRLAQRRMRRIGIQVDRHILRGERLPFRDGAFDCVVCTFTLCSIDNVEEAVAQAFRVLRPGGRFLFLEHGLNPDPAVQIRQRRLNWFQRLLGDGCRLDRNIKELVAAQPFATVQSHESYLERTPKTHGYLYRGIATK